MSGFIGVPGAMVELLYRGGLSTATDRPVSKKRTLGGKVKMLIGPRARREWKVSFDLIGASEVSGVIDMARAGGEVMWYPSDASLGNLLSPQAVGFEVTPESATDAGLVQLPDGTVARTVVSDVVVRPGSAHGTYEMVPVRAGERVTVGAWSRGGQHFRGFWRDATGSSITNWSTAAASWSGWRWHEATLTPPPGAAFIELHLAGGTQYARPVVSWGSKARDQPGRGCPRAIVHGLSEELTVIHLDDDSFGSFNVEITEVG